MTAEAAKGLATYEDLLAVPEGERAEVLGGELLMAPAPLPRHLRVQGALWHFIGGACDLGAGDGEGGWWILPEPDVRLSPHDVVRPDLAGWRRERLPEPWDQRPIDEVPDWVCEVISPSTAGRDRVAKMELYRRSGVGFCWLVDPQAETLEAYRRELAPGGQGIWMRLGAWGRGDRIRLAPFEAVELDVGRLFPPPRSRDAS